MQLFIHHLHLTFPKNELILPLPANSFSPDFSFSQCHLILPVAEAKNLDYSFSLTLPSMHQEILQKYISQQLPISLQVSAYSGLITPHCLYQPISHCSHLTSFHPDRLGSLLFLEPSVRVLSSGSLHGTLPPYIFIVHSFTPFKSAQMSSVYSEASLNILFKLHSPLSVSSFLPSIHHLLTYYII